MDSIETLLEPFTGYFHLGMFHEANDVLEALPVALKTHPKVLEALLVLLMEMKRWGMESCWGQSLIELWPQELEFHFKTAYCLHELRRTKEAKTILLSAPEAIRDTAVFYYNLACYEAQLGNVDEGKRLLKQCFAKEPRFREEALDDLDLEPIWGSIG